MTRVEALSRLREELNRHGLTEWSVRMNQNADSRYLGMCIHRDKTIVLNAHHIDIHPTPDVVNTILHEVAHALTPGHAHDDIWSTKAREIGCDNTMPCSNLSLSPEIIDAIRSGAEVVVTFDEQVIRTPKYTVTRLQDKCEVCGVVAKMKSERTVKTRSEKKPDMKMITLECGHIMMKRIPKGTPFHLFQMGGDESCEHSWDKNNCVKCNRKRPYDFQLEGMRFIERALATGKGVGIFDEMALGKTIQMMGYSYFHQAETSPLLIIVKSGLKYQTSAAVLYWMGDKFVPQVVNTSKDWLIPGLKVYIIGYDMLVQKERTLKNGTKVRSGFDISQFDRVGIKCVALDECQQIKNVDSARTQMVRRIVKDRKVIALSGTPWNNRGSELFPVLNMIDPVKFHSEALFVRQWVDTYYVGNTLKQGGIRNIPRFRELTKDLIIRRERAEVMPELPLVNRTKLNVVMNDVDAHNYDAAVEAFVEWYERESADMGSMAIIAAMAKLRHLVALAKVPATVEYVTEFMEETDRKIVVFAHHIDAQQIIFMELKEKFGDEMPVLALTGEMSDARQRYDIQTQFNNAPRAILVASQLASGEGLNLQTCADCVMHERQWNPGKEEQCESRFPRPGTTATSVNAIYMHMNGLTAIDVQLDGIVERKRIQFHNTHNKGEVQKWNEDELMKELASSIVNAHNAKKNRQIAQRA